jgi:hypothetical protein
VFWQSPATLDRPLAIINGNRFDAELKVRFNRNA